MLWCTRSWKKQIALLELLGSARKRRVEATKIRRRALAMVEAMVAAMVAAIKAEIMGTRVDAVLVVEMAAKVAGNTNEGAQAARILLHRVAPRWIHSMNLQK